MRPLAGGYSNGSYYNETKFFYVQRFFSILKENHFRQNFEPITEQICPAVNQIPRLANSYFQQLARVPLMSSMDISFSSPDMI